MKIFSRKNSILSLLPLLSIVILGAHLIGDSSTASAIPGLEVEVNDQIKIQDKGKGTCIFGEDSGKIKANAKFLLLVQESDGSNYNGVAKVDLKTKSTCDGIPNKWQNDGPLLFAYNADSNELIFSGEIKAGDDTIFDLVAHGSFNEGGKKKTTIDMSIESVGLGGEGFTIDFGSATVSWKDGCDHCTSTDF